VALRVDLWPAEAVLPDGRVVTGVRAMVTRDGQLVVWQDVTGVAKAVAHGPILDSSQMPERGAFWTEQRFTAVTPTGSVIVNATAPRSCNCGGGAVTLLSEADALNLLAA
jgi:hypothetical protein